MLTYPFNRGRLTLIELKKKVKVNKVILGKKMGFFNQYESALCFKADI